MRSLGVLHLGGRLTVENLTEILDPDVTTVKKFEILGAKFNLASDVLIGNIPVDSFDIVSDRKIVITVSSFLSRSVTIQNIRVLTFFDTPVGTSDLVFDIATRARPVSGTGLMIQKFITLLMDPAVGNLNSMVPKGINLNPQMVSPILNRVAIAVSVTRTRMLRTTPRAARPDETLESATVTNGRLQGDTLLTSIRLVSRARTTATVPVTI